MILGFFHIARIGGSWFDSIRTTWENLKKSGLYDATEHIYVCLVGTNNTEIPPNYNAEEFERIIRDPKIILTEYEAADVFEFVTYIKMMEVCRDVPPNTKLWYIHSKGATTAVFVPPYSPERKNPAAYWKEYMEYFIIERWRDCNSLLDSYDIVGTEWREHPHKHYSGNWWWSSAGYIQKLPDPTQYMEQYRWDRFMPEMYVGRANPNHYCFHNFGQDLYRFAAEPHLYRS